MTEKDKVNSVIQLII